MKDRLYNIGIIVVYVSLFLLFINGLAHSVKKHTGVDAIIDVLFFPFGIYRGAEAFWHEDHSDIDWNKRNKNDMRIIYGMMVNTNEANKYSGMRDIESFSNEINSYPKEQIDFLKIGSKKAISSMKLIEKDMTDYCYRYFGGDTSMFSFSEKTKYVFSELKQKYFFEEEDIISEKEWDKLLKSRLEYDGKITKKIRDEFFKTMQDNHEKGDKQMIKVYNTIFGENP